MILVKETQHIEVLGFALVVLTLLEGILQLRTFCLRRQQIELIKDWVEVIDHLLVSTVFRQTTRWRTWNRSGNSKKSKLSTGQALATILDAFLTYILL